MAELDRRYGQSVGRADAGAIDQGLRAYMIRVYNYMAMGVTLTGLAESNEVLTDSGVGDAFDTKLFKK